MEGFLKCSKFRYLGVIWDIWIFEHLSVCNFEQRGGISGIPLLSECTVCGGGKCVALNQ